MRREDIAESIPCGDDVDAFVKAVREIPEAGFTDVALVQIGGENQDASILQIFRLSPPWSPETSPGSNQPPRGATSGRRTQYNRNTCHGQLAPQADVVLQYGDQNLCLSRIAVADDPVTIRPLTAARLPDTKV